MKKNGDKYINTVVLSVLLSGCATQSAYIQPNHSERPVSSLENHNNHADHSTSSIENNFNSNDYKGYDRSQDNSAQGQQYLCANITDNQAQALFNQGHAYLDRDKDGRPCEWKDKYLESQINQPTSTGGNCHQVRGYTRKNGTYVRGHTRCR